jgi:hypothetical protein
MESYEITKECEFIITEYTIGCRLIKSPWIRGRFKERDHCSGQWP